MAKYVSPAFKLGAYTCMFCEVLAPVRWEQLFVNITRGFQPTSLWFGTCDHCGKRSLWCDVSDDTDDGDTAKGRLIEPSSVTAPMAHEDMPGECLGDFDEAREIASRSPRGAAALLRLCLQKLCVHLGGSGKNINDDIGTLVKAGLAAQVQQALDYVRITGNNAVHPGEISLEETPEHVGIMFDMINLIVEERIHRPKMIAERFGSLPAGALEAIAKRDQPKL
ncbi:hypothetical protein BR1R5_33780 [Pseudomonas sp. BR1R-5]|uniref:DUF4145 domain-containing protein n=1 Tax=Pseudomonas sp. BR1R-5 TaxID=3003626 RepID=UPI0022CA46EC|nr:DUF4145 domain-containing protein [Pseudomonas sp. BR1R-5]GLH33990.1 hypothetical protein BR1R5_33780 [Pseudomonas sp. BR1R-5]